MVSFWPQLLYCIAEPIGVQSVIDGFDSA
jgi:hypothetical protein